MSFFKGQLLVRGWGNCCYLGTVEDQRASGAEFSGTVDLQHGENVVPERNLINHVSGQLGAAVVEVHGMAVRKPANSVKSVFLGAGELAN